jgi:beta-lactamase superfamily II metal-dependent hydrolase
MKPTHAIAVDLARVFSTATGREQISTLLWGDPVEVVATTADHVEILMPEMSPGVPRTPGFIRPTKASHIAPSEAIVGIAEHRVLKIDFVDVQQGDGCTIETPRGKVMLIDGGDNQLFARHLAGRFRTTTLQKPLPVECIVITHGDADHFLGVAEILESETNANPQKRVFIQPRRVYHNGLVKRPTTRGGHTLSETELLGATVKVGGDVIITGLERNLLEVDDAEMNAPFRRWKGCLRTWNARGDIQFERLAFGDDGRERFGFLADEDIQVDVLGPFLTKAEATTGLKFLRQPPTGPRIGHESLDASAPHGGSLSSSHTINGHSVVLRVSYGSFHMLFTGDLNDEAGRTLTRAHNRGELNLRSEVLKVPHHGSADFSGALLQAIAPVISIVSSGDESARKEYIHPRATLMGALGRWSRVEEPLIFVTELVAFFSVVGVVVPEMHVLANGKAVIEHGEAKLDPHAGRPFFAFNRTEFGLVKVRTDGTRLLVATNSGLTTLKEAYAYTMDDLGQPIPSAIRQA